MTLRTDEITNVLSDLAHDMRLRQAIVITAMLKGGPMEVTHRDVFDSAAHDLRVERTPHGFSVSLVDAPN